MEFAIFVSKSGEVYGIGKNDYGQLGTGNSEGTSTFVRCPVIRKIIIEKYLLRY